MNSTLYPNLISELSRYNVSIDSIAELLGRAPNNVRLRLKGLATLSCAEACKIRDYLNDKFDTNFTLDYLFATEPTPL